MKKLISVVFLFTLSVTIAAADVEFDRAALCSKAKSCAVAEANAQGIPPHFVDMMEPVFDAQCVAEVNKYVQSIVAAKLESKASACVASVQSVNCDRLKQSYEQSEPPTQACDDFQKAADQAGIQLY